MEPTAAGGGYPLIYNGFFTLERPWGEGSFENCLDFCGAVAKILSNNTRHASRKIGAPGRVF
jgi:hypothetical protein